MFCAVSKVNKPSNDISIYTRPMKPITHHRCASVIKLLFHILSWPYTGCTDIAWKNLWLPHIKIRKKDRISQYTSSSTQFPWYSLHVHPTSVLSIFICVNTYTPHCTQLQMNINWHFTKAYLCVWHYSKPRRDLRKGAKFMNRRVRACNDTGGKHFQHLLLLVTS
jgi:hypothetical protein